jgi:hypothetical protein
MSKGAEPALIFTSRYPLITRAAAFAPYAYWFRGLAFKNVSSWTHREKSLPFVQLRNRRLIADTLSCFIKNKPFGFTHTYKKSLEAAKNKEVARIKVEDAHADLLLFTSRECGMWNPYDGSVEIMNALREHNYPHRSDLIAYEDAGEPCHVPYVFPVTKTTVKMAPRLVLSIGGSFEGNAEAQKKPWAKTIECFERRC